MITSWTELLSTCNEQSLRLHSPAPENWLTALPDIGVIRVTGEDSQSFLQGQLCNDLRSLERGAHQLNGYCQPKGRLLALFRVQACDNGYLLICPKNTIAPTLQRLRMFVLRAKVMLEDVSEQWRVLGGSGAALESALAEAATTPMANTSGSGHVDEHWQALCLSLPTGQNRRWLLLLQDNELSTQLKMWQSQNIEWVNASHWQAAEIAAGLPQVTAETREAFIPQMMNLHLVDGLSFSKGCYPGQEIVARSQYLGQLKRRMSRYRVATEAPISAGSDIVLDGDKVGTVVSAAPDDAPFWQLLAVMKTSAEAADALHLGERVDAPLERLPLPYEFEPTKEN